MPAALVLFTPTRPRLEVKSVTDVLVSDADVWTTGAIFVFHALRKPVAKEVISAWLGGPGANLTWNTFAHLAPPYVPE